MPERRLSWAGDIGEVGEASCNWFSASASAALQGRTRVDSMPGGNATEFSFFLNLKAHLPTSRCRTRLAQLKCIKEKGRLSRDGLQNRQLATGK